MCVCSIQAQTKIKLGATAGLRLLPEGKADIILDEVQKFLKTYPFQLDAATGVTILDGETLEHAQRAGSRLSGNCSTFLTHETWISLKAKLHERVCWVQELSSLQARPTSCIAESGQACYRSSHALCMTHCAL